MFAALRISATRQHILRPARVLVQPALAHRLYTSGNKPNQFTMGQEGGNKKKNGKSGLIFGLHPFAIFASLTLLGSGYLMIVKPFLQWNEKDKGKKKDEVVAKYSDEQIAQFPFSKKTVVFVLGGPGSGKGTNSAKLVEDFGFVHLSAGDLLREEQKREVSQYGELIAHNIREGIIVPHEITIGLLRNAMMDRPECNRFLIDGFPRNLVQAKAFEDTVCRAKKVLYFECPESILLERLLDRGKTSGRSDDNIESIKKRFKVYVNDSKPVIDAFEEQGRVITISCQGSVDAVYKNAYDQMAAFFKEIGQEPKEKISPSKPE
ncbi:bifunctional uridylate/adenylate kinase [Coemansia erecta]|uniref:Uridylate kinase n=1 Tax=Coemansia asiatica TaxID=1052880 RepID=A0A9W7XIT8_9FUNG|nr:bifunctional uridylate/adenylate kinase [Coemansia asiatica]KAJ2858623.1 bifunctional uridylate/adenylate kinase [Coemansia erecta]KAJ2883347.1 bifunctional uridylate/adenylate kinase [Coemansia asiatica]